MKKRGKKSGHNPSFKIRTIAVLSPPSLENILGGAPQYSVTGLLETGDHMNKTLTFFCCRQRWD